MAQRLRTKGTTVREKPESDQGKRRRKACRAVRGQRKVASRVSCLQGTGGAGIQESTCDLGIRKLRHLGQQEDEVGIRALEEKEKPDVKDVTW